MPSGITVKTLEPLTLFFSAESLDAYHQHASPLPGVLQKLQIGGKVLIPANHSLVMSVNEGVVYDLPDDTLVCLVPVQGW